MYMQSFTGSKASVKSHNIILLKNNRCNSKIKQMQMQIKSTCNVLRKENLKPIVTPNQNEPDCSNIILHGLFKHLNFISLDIDFNYHYLNSNYFRV